MLKPKYDAFIKMFKDHLHVGFAMQISEQTDKLVRSLGLSDIEKAAYYILIDRYTKLDYHGMPDNSLSNAYWVGFDICFDVEEVANHIKELLEAEGFSIILSDNRDEKDDDNHTNAEVAVF